MDEIEVCEIMFKVMLTVLGGVFGGYVASAILCLISRGSFKEWAKGRSRCESCGKELSWLETVPVLSYLAQKGKCNHCKVALDYKYAVVEMLGVSIGASAVAQSSNYGFSPAITIITVTIMLMFLIAAIYDFVYTEIASNLVYLMTIASVIYPIFREDLNAMLLIDLGIFLVYSAVWLYQRQTGWTKSGDGFEVVGFGLADMFLMLCLNNMFGPLMTGMVLLWASSVYYLMSRCLAVYGHPVNKQLPLYPYVGLGLIVPIAIMSIL